MAPTQPARALAHAQKDLPPSVEAAYYRKCIDLRRRINDITDSNDAHHARIIRQNRGVSKLRLERAFLLEQINKHMEYNIDDSDRSSSPPPTPTDKPLRSKRSHRKGTPPPAGAQHQSPSNSHVQQQHQSMLQHPINLPSSAQSTPDPGRVVPSNYYPNVGAPGASPHGGTAVNGMPTLPPLHNLPPLQPLSRGPEPLRAYYDPTYDEQRPAEEDVGRRRAYSGAQQPPPQNGDTEMVDAGFTAVNNNR